MARASSHICAGSCSVATSHRVHCSLVKNHHPSAGIFQKVKPPDPSRQPYPPHSTRQKTSPPFAGNFPALAHNEVVFPEKHASLVESGGMIRGIVESEKDRHAGIRRSAPGASTANFNPCRTLQITPGIRELCGGTPPVNPFTGGLCIQRPQKKFNPRIAAESRQCTLGDLPTRSSAHAAPQPAPPL